MVLAVLLMAQFTALGMNSDLLSAIAALADILTAAVIVGWVRPDRRLLFALAPVLALLGCALLWSIAPDIAFLASGNAVDLGGHLTPDLTSLCVARFAGQTALLIAAACLGRRRDMLRPFVDALLLLGVANVVLGLLLWRADPAHVFGYGKSIHSGRFTGTLQNANAAGAFYGMLVLLAFGRVMQFIGEGAYLSSGRPFVRFSAAALEMFVMLGACMATASRASLAVTVLVGLVVLFWSSASLSGTIRRRVLPVAGILLVLLAMLPVLAEHTFLRASTIGSDSAVRVAMWRYFLARASEAPLRGYGPGSFSVMSLSGISSSEDALLLWNINAAHNQLLQMVLAGGVPYLLLILTAAALIGYRITRARTALFRRPVTSGLAGGAVVLLGCSFVDIAMTFPAIMASCLVLAGLLWGRSLDPARRPPSVRRTSRSADGRGHLATTGEQPAA